MKKVTLLQMNIVNFKGIKEKQINFNGKNTLITGLNEVGKSTIVDAYYWLTIGQNALGNTKFEVRPRDYKGNEIHDVKTSVECVFSVDNDGQAMQFALRRDEIEDLTQKQRTELKENAIAPKKSYYFIDNAPYTQKIFNNKIEELFCGLDYFSIISNPYAFFRLNETNQRQLLTMICGDVSDNKIDGYEQVREICGAVNTPTQTKEALSKEIKAKQKEFDSIPTEIKTHETYCERYADYEKLISETEHQKAELEKEYAELKKQDKLLLASAKKQLKRPDESNITSIENKIKLEKSSLVGFKRTLQQLHKQKADNSCPNCGFPLLDFSTQIKTTEKNIEKANKNILKMNQMLEGAKKSYQMEMDIFNSQMADFDNQEQGLLNERENIATKMEEMRSKFLEITTNLDKLNLAKKAQEQIALLNEKHNKLDEEIADRMTKYDIVNKFILDKSEAVVSIINKNFKEIQFKLFEMQTNGDLKTCCKVMKDGVSYANINTASKVHAGLEIAKLFCDYFGIILPIWIDEKESINTLPTMENQFVCAKVLDFDSILPNQDEFASLEEYLAAKEKLLAEYKGKLFIKEV